MKSSRQNAILTIISTKNIDTQEELSDELAQLGFSATQATISRDIKELRLVKVHSNDGAHHYAISAKSDTSVNKRILRLFTETVISIQSAYNQIVIKTIPGSANFVCEALDKMHFPEVIGTIAGDNTILLILSDIDEVEKIKQCLSDYIKR